MEDKNQKQEERIQKQFAFSVEIDKEKEIGRQTYLASGSRKEDDAEHAWHMAIMAYLFREHANEKIDILRTIMMILTHDLVEVYAGDTYAYDEEGKKSQKQRELAAADKLYSILPEDQAAEMRALWDEFEAGQTPEAKFAHAMDNLQPMILNVASDGISWTEKDVYLQQVLDRNARTHEGSEILWDYAVDKYLRPSVEKKWLIASEEEKKAL